MDGNVCRSGSKASQQEDSHYHISKDKCDHRKFSPFLIDGQSEHSKIQDTHIGEQYQVVTIPGANKERCQKSPDKRDDSQFAPVIQNGQDRHEQRYSYQNNKGDRLREKVIKMKGNGDREIENGKGATRKQGAECAVLLCRRSATTNNAEPVRKPSTVRNVSLIQSLSMAYFTKKPTPMTNTRIPILPKRFSPMNFS